MNLLLVVAVRERPWQAQEDQRMQDDRSAFPVEGTDLPIQVATGRSGSEDAQGNAACRGEVCRASIAAGASRLGSSRRRLMDL